MWIPLAIAAFIVWRVVAHKTNPGNLTPERQAVYQVAMTGVQDPAKLRNLAQSFERGGLPEQAAALRKRASLPSLPKNVHEARMAALKKAFRSTDVEAISDLADSFEREGLGRAASMLRDYAAGVKTAQDVQSITLPPMPQPEPEPPPPAPPPTEQQAAQNPTSQVPPTGAGGLMGPPPPEPPGAPPSPPVHGDSPFGLGTVIPSQAPQPPQPPQPPMPPPMPGSPWGNGSPS